MKRTKKKGTKGITLIALVITIIVLLILATVSIETLTGDEGILNQIGKAEDENSKASAEEQVKLAVVGSYGKNGKLDYKELKDNLNKITGIVGVPNEITDDNFPLKVKVNGYEVTINANGKVESTGGETFFPEELTVGVETATNTNKYGWKVKKYNVSYKVGTTETTSNVWRLFYQDEKYTYLITDELVENYQPSNYYGSYTDMTKMSIVGQKLNGRISELFTDTNIKSNVNLQATAWFTDTTEEGPWAKYKNEDATFSIASPTAELFEASYNKNTDSDHTSTYKKGDISVTLGTYGYTVLNYDHWLKAEDSHGIYNKDDSSPWWLSSPNDLRDDGCLFVSGLYRSYHEQQRVPPLKCGSPNGLYSNICIPR